MDMIVSESWTVVFLHSHNPFSLDDPPQPRNTSTGVVADHRVNHVDDAVNIGAKIQEIFTGKTFGYVTMKKKDQAQTFSIMRKPIKVDGGRCAHAACGAVLPATLHCLCQWSQWSYDSTARK